jgi:hypothetical protein
MVGLQRNQSRPGNTHGQKVLNAAGGDTGVAPHAFGQIDDHSPSHFVSLPYYSLIRNA